MIKIAVKAGLRELNLYDMQYENYEAYINHNDKLTELLNSKMNLISIHFPNKIKIKDNLFTTNFLDENIVGDECIKYLKQLVVFANENGVSNIILHAGFYNIYNSNRKQKLDELISKLGSVEVGGATICIENVPRWTKQAFENTPIVSNIKDMQYIRKNNSKLGFVIDIDHIAIDTVFTSFINNRVSYYPSIKNKQKYKERLHKAVLNYISGNVNRLTSEINNAIRDYFSGSIIPNIIHAVGSDFTRYFPYDSLPFIGEALPLEYSGSINGYNVKDRIDHRIWIKKLVGKEIVTLEFMNRPDYSYHETINSDITTINNIL